MSSTTSTTNATGTAGSLVDPLFLTETGPQSNANGQEELLATQWGQPSASFSVASTAAAPSGPNAIVLENMRQGTPQSVWDLTNGPSSAIEGFTTDISYDLGATVSFKINSEASDYRIEIYRLGYYGGDGARLVGVVDHTAASVIVQPDALRDAATGLVDAGNWSVTDTFTLPSDAVSGIYIAKLVREDGTAGENHIPFIVRNDAAPSDIVFQTADTTWQAYNGWGGANLYGGNGPGGDSAPGRAYAVSYNRPITTREGGGTYAGPQDFIFGAEVSAVRWLEMNGYDVSYISGVDTARNGAGLLDHKVFLSVGHDEYWSGQQRANVEAARDAGVNLAFLSGNAMYWRTRWEASIDGSDTDYRTLVSYKETRAGAKIDPSSEWTGTWRDLSFDPSVGGQTPENALQGTQFQVDSYRLDTITIPYPMTQLRFWRNTAVAETAPGETAALVQNLLGYEWDIAPDNPFTPDGMIRLSSSTIDVNSLLYDYGTSVGPGTATHNLTLYRAESGALVFGAGTVYWVWGLDSNHDLEATPTDANVQQAMVNLFADMGVQPQTLQGNLVPGAVSSDFTAPTATLNALNGAVREGQRVLLTGSAADVGGRVAGVEVSSDGGATWRMATLDASAATWSFTWTAPTAGNYQLVARSIDDSLNLGFSSTPVAVTVAEATQVSLFGAGETPPPLPGDWDPATVPVCCHVCVVHVFGPAEVGVKFAADRSGTISSIRFYKDDRNTGPHTANLWKADGTLLASATFTSESASGWQQVNFAAPVTIAAGQVYIASYGTTEGIFLAAHGAYFAEERVSGPLRALASDWRTGPSGVIATGGTGIFPGGPVQSATNYWVDVVFNPNSTVGNAGPTGVADSGISAERGVAKVIAAATLLGNDTDPNGDPLSITGVSGALNGSVSWDAYRQAVTFTPTAGYTGTAGFTYTLTDGRGGTSTAQVTIAVEEPPYRVGLFSANETPAFTTVADANPVALGVRFTASAAGSISGIRFYKGSLNTGTHTAHLWTAGGTLLASATFTNETATGWQQVFFASPVALAAGQSYVAGYHTTSGMYSATPGYFSAGHSNGPLTVDPGSSGLFSYGPAGSVPTQTYNATNYWVDVLFEPASGANVAPDATADGPFAVIRNGAITLTAAMLLGNDSDANLDPLSITGVSGALHGTAVWDPVARTVTFTPDAGYTGVAGFTYAISDGRGGVDTATVSLEVQPPPTYTTLFSATATPSMPTVNDASGVELGMRFQVTGAGRIDGIRFYKGALNSGTHVGKLYTADGTLLASATFTNESSTGWQQVSFAAPVIISAGQTYVASYHTTSGYYSATPGFFAAGPYANNGIVAAGGNNGVYRYGSGGFPTQSFNSTNYWVDVMFEPGNSAPAAGDDSGVTTATDTPVVISVAALLANDTDPNGGALTITAVGNANGGTVVLDSQAGTITFTPGAGFAGVAGFDYTVSDADGGTDEGRVSIDVTAPGANERLFASTAMPAITSSSDTNAVELGVRFSADVGGLVTGVRFYKGAGNTGTHVGRLWSADGTILAQATFTNESASGWQQVNFANAVSIVAGQTYVASYHTGSGHYSATAGYFATGHENGVLNVAGGANGVFAYGSGGFPTQSWNSTNYWVDVVMDARNRAPVAGDDTGPMVSGAMPRVVSVAGLLANDTDPDGDALAITGITGATGGTAVFDAQAGTITFTANPGHVGAASFSYAVADARGGTDQATVSLTVAPAALSIFTPSTTPAIASVADANAIELGMRFESAVDGSVTGVRFYKGELNTGTHVGKLWTASGGLLGSVTFTNETASGWQQADFAAPIAITAGTDYVVSYHTSSGFYSATGGGFATAQSNGPLSAPAAVGGGANGLYAYGAGAFPTGTYNATNYFVDVVFQPQLAA